MSPVATADNLALVAEEKLGRGEPRVDLDPEAFRARPQPLHDRAQRADEIAVVVHQPRHRPVRQLHAAGRGQEIETVFAHRGLERAFRVGSPIGAQPVEPDRIDDGARKNVRADRRALLDHHHRDIRVERLQADRCGQPGRAGADDDDVVLHQLSGRQASCIGHRSFRSRILAIPERSFTYELYSVNGRLRSANACRPSPC